MKKALLAIAVIATVACLSSCNKTCTCKTYLLGVASGDGKEVELDKDSYNKCSDLNTYTLVDGKKNGVECK